MIGTILNDRYYIKESLGSGGFGEVYLAEYPCNLNVKSRKKCVIKKLKDNRANDEDIDRFKKEAEQLFKLELNEIPKFIEYFDHNNNYYIVQEYIHGHDLSYEITDGSPWEANDVIDLLQQLLRILIYLQQQDPPVIHRDIKPKNIMRRYQDNRFILIDFGVTKEFDDQKINGFNEKTEPNGTLLYMPPEQLDGKPELSSDIYALGLTIIQAITGLSPHKIIFKNHNNWHDNIDDWLANILDKMIQKDFLHRYQNAEEVFNDLTENIERFAPNYSPHFLYPFIEKHKWGYKNKDNEIVIKPQFDGAKKFSEDLAAVQLGNFWGYIDREGVPKISPSFFYAGKFSEGLARVRGEGKKFGYINKQGKRVNQDSLDGALDFSEELAPVLIGKKWGYMDKEGNISIEPQFYLAENFSEGQAKVKNDPFDEWKVIDKTGKLIEDTR